MNSKVSWIRPRANIIAIDRETPLAIDLYPANINDNQRIENILDVIPELNGTYNKPIKIASDLGYLINKERNQKIRKKYHVTIVTSKRKNMKKRVTPENKKLLKKRFCVEHFHALIRGKFKNLKTITDKTFIKIKRWFIISFCYLIIKKMN